MSRYAIAPLSSGAYASYNPATASRVERLAHDGLLEIQASRDEYRALLEIAGARAGESKEAEAQRVREMFTARMEHELLGVAENPEEVELASPNAMEED